MIEESEGTLRAKLAACRAKTTLKVGDRLRVTGCPGTKRWITFAGWDREWILTKSGCCNQDYHPLNIDRINSGGTLREINFALDIQQLAG